MKIVAIDNFGREGPGHDDLLIAESVNKAYGWLMVDMFNNPLRPYYNDTYYFVLKHDDYKLREFEA